MSFEGMTLVVCFVSEEEHRRDSTEFVIRIALFG